MWTVLLQEECPDLTTCLHSDAVRPTPQSCCKVCPAPPPATSLPPKPAGKTRGRLNDMGRRRTGADVLSAGGCSWRGLHHENGASWHPTVEPWGEMKCVTCLCKVSPGVDGLTALQTAGREHRL